MNLNLNRCPFCGGAAEIEENTYTRLTEYSVKCIICGASSKSFSADEDFAEEAKAKAISAWQMRSNNKEDK